MITEVEYEYITFKFQEQKSKTVVYKCVNNHSDVMLGLVKWHGPWRRYCYFPSCPAIYSSGCLNDIKDFIDSLMESRRLRLNSGKNDSQPSKNP